MTNKAISNLELGRELYTEDQRRQFYIEYQAALSARDVSYDECVKHALTDPRGWQFWKRPPAGWKEERLKLMLAYRQCVLDVKALEQQHPLLAQVFVLKDRPL